MTCDLCHGRWRKRPAPPPAEGEAFVEGHDIACPRCCSIVATAEIQAFATEALGVWPRGFDARLELTGWYSPVRGSWGAPVVPLHLRTGFDLGTRLLASRLGADVEASVSFFPGDDGWCLCANYLDGREAVWHFLPEGAEGITNGIPVPGISEIPADLSPRIRVAAALRLAWDAVPEAP